MKKKSYFLKQKKGWIRIAEAALAILILSSFLLLILSKQIEDSGIGEDMYRLEHLILQEAAANDSIRSAVLTSSNLNLIESFIGDRMPLGIDYNITVCNSFGSCEVGTPTVNKELYADDILISSTLQQYQPKRLKIAAWITGGETVRKRYGGVSSVMAYYFEEGSGTIVRDSSGNSFNGDIKNLGPLTWSIGRFGEGLNFTGTEFVNISFLPDIKDDITIEAWVNPGTLNENDVIIMKPHTDDSDPGSMYSLRIGKNNNLRFTVTIENSNPHTPQIVDTPDNTLNIGEWQYVAGVYDGKRMRVYINGAELSSQSLSGKIETNSMPVWIAKGKVSGAANWFNGRVDSLRIYSKALTATEILQHYQNG